MSPIYLYNNAILVVNNALAASLSCCCSGCTSDNCFYTYCVDLGGSCGEVGGGCETCTCPPGYECIAPDNPYSSPGCGRIEEVPNDTTDCEALFGFAQVGAWTIVIHDGVCCDNVCYETDAFCILNDEIYSGPYNSSFQGCVIDGEVPTQVNAVCCSGQLVPDYPGLNPCECPPYTIWVPGTPEDPGNCVDPGWNCIGGNCVAWDGNGDVEFPSYNDCITYCV